MTSSQKQKKNETFNRNSAVVFTLILVDNPQLIGNDALKKSRCC